MDINWAQITRLNAPLDRSDIEIGCLSERRRSKVMMNETLQSALPLE